MTAIPADRRLRLLVGGVVAAGVVAIVAGLPRLGTPPPLWHLLLVGAALLLADVPLLHIRFGKEHHSFTWSEAAVVVGMATLPSPWMRMVAPLSIGLCHALARRPPVKIAFNAMASAVGVVLARWAANLVGGPDVEAADPRRWLALSVGALAWFLWNNATVSAAVAFSQGLPFTRIYRRGLPLWLIVWFGNTVLGVTAVAMAATQPALLVVFPLILAILAGLYRSYLRAMQERDTWEQVQATSRELLQTDGEQLCRTALQRSASLFEADFVEVIIAGRGPGEARAYRWSPEGITRTDATIAELAGPFWGRATCEREAFRVSAATAAASQRAELEELGVAQCMVAPLLTHDTVLGTLRVGWRKRPTIRPRELQVFTTIANHLSAAANNVRLFEDIRHQALHDPLTGLPNRVLLLDRLETALARSRRTRSRVAVLFFDLDRFKIINDSLGHHAGDVLIQAVAERISRCLRPGDTATRFAGDEFVVICEEVEDELQARALAGRLAGVLREPFLIDGRTVVVTVSVGVSIASADGSDDPRDLIRDADAAMFRAKDRGRGRCEVFDADLRAEAVNRLETEQDLRRAVQGGELILHYQPVVSIADQRTTGVEALVRWEHPTRGLVAPDQFVALAEETGLIGALGTWVLNAACRQLAAWSRPDSGMPPEFTVAVNLSPLQLANPALVEVVAAALARTGAPAGRLCLEITESALLGDADGSLETLRRLRALGVRIALDDFGTGYSSLSYLHALPVDVLKIDRSFCGRLGGAARDRAIVAGMVDLAHALDLTVVAEGVETPAQLADLAALGCDAAQGFYFSRPEPAAVVAEAVGGGPAVDVAAMEARRVLRL